MLSAKNLNAIEDAELSFIVGSRISKAPYDLAAHFERHGNAFDDGQVLESARVMGTGKSARSRRVVYQYRFARHRHDDRAINAMVDRAEKVAAGKRPLKKDRFVRIEATGTEVDWALIERARQLAGLKGYVTNLPASTMDGQAVVCAYHDLWQVEKSFRMAKSDLRARPVFHHKRESIEAHLTVVFAALAVSRHLQDATGVSIKNIVHALRAVRSATIRLGGHEITLDPDIPAAAQAIPRPATADRSLNSVTSQIRPGFHTRRSPNASPRSDGDTPVAGSPAPDRRLAHTASSRYTASAQMIATSRAMVTIAHKG
jgi:hypothetical protein